MRNVTPCEYSQKVKHCTLLILCKWKYTIIINIYVCWSQEEYVWCKFVVKGWDDTNPIASLQPTLTDDIFNEADIGYIYFLVYQIYFIFSYFVFKIVRQMFTGFRIVHPRCILRLWLIQPSISKHWPELHHNCLHWISPDMRGKRHNLLPQAVCCSAAGRCVYIGLVLLRMLLTSSGKKSNTSSLLEIQWLFFFTI